MKTQSIETLCELEQALTTLVRTSNARTVIIGGHYPLNMRGEAETSPEGTFGIFPEYTFGLACRLAASSNMAKIALVVDDHSLMAPRDWYRSSEASAAVASTVKHYFDRFTIPDNYATILAAHDLKESNLIRASPTRTPFQESAFRLLFEKEHGVPAGCAGEYRYILKNLQEQGIKHIMSLIPQRCQGPTCQAANSFTPNMGDMRISQAYLPSDSDICSSEELQERITTGGGVPLVTFG